MTLATPNLRDFRLVYRALGSSTLVDRRFQAAGVEEAFAIAGNLIADELGMPGAYVAFDRTTGRVTIGAGYRSRRGSFRLEIAPGEQV